MSKPRKVSALIHKAMPVCCRHSILRFAAEDRYMGAGERGDRIRCDDCGNWLVYGEGRVNGWRVAASAAQNTETCKACGGTGKLPDKIGIKIGRKTQTNFSRCRDCGGSGVAAQNTEEAALPGEDSQADREKGG